MRAVLVVIAVLTLACDGGGPAGPDTTIQVLDNSFSPQTFNAKVGEVVTWLWVGNQPHDVKFGDGGSSSDVLNRGGQFERSFTMAGTFNYVCTLHACMVGSVVVSL